MKQFLFLFSFLILSAFAQAQYVSPGSGVKFNLDSLVKYSGGVVTGTYPDFEIHANVDIAKNDTLEISPAYGETVEIKLDTAIELSIYGVMLSNERFDSAFVRFSAKDAAKPWKVILFDNSDASKLYNTTITQGGGIRLIESDIHIEACHFLDNKRMGTTNTLNIFKSSPVIVSSFFIGNQGSAIGGGANIANAPKIYNSVFIANNTQNDNRPQINLGASGTDTIVIKGCRIATDSTLYPISRMAGGISVFPLGGANVRIEDCYIEDNRYGITLLGSNISSVIRYNTILNNNIQNDPILGGSGINFNGDTTNRSVVEHNTIAGNLWGITIQGNAKPNMGDSVNVAGENSFENNGHDGVVYALYNNTPNTIYAQNNWWGSNDADTVEMVIFHHPDDSILGWVNYNPYIIRSIPIGVEVTKAGVVNVFPNPATDKINLNWAAITSQEVKLNLFDVTGRLVRSENLLRDESLAIADLRSGMYILEISNGQESRKVRVMKN